MLWRKASPCACSRRGSRGLSAPRPRRRDGAAFWRASRRFYPFRSVAGDRLLLRVARRLAAVGSASELVVFGAALDDEALMATGCAFVAGPTPPQDYAELARDYGADALLAPGRGGGYGELEAAAAQLGAPKAFFDWSFGAFPVEWGDLSLDPRICDDKAAAQIVAWIHEERLS